MTACNDIEVKADGSICSVRKSMEKGTAGEKELVSHVRRIITQINDGHDFGEPLAGQWSSFLRLLAKGRETHLMNPYADLEHYHSEPITEAMVHAKPMECIRILEAIPNQPLSKTDPEASAILEKTLLVLAVGGADSTFYSGLSADESRALEEALFSEPLRLCFNPQDATAHGIPRALASKRSGTEPPVSILESIVLQAYHAGIRNVAIIGNTRTAGPMQTYLQSRFKPLADLNLFIIIQPLLPIIHAYRGQTLWTVSAENGSYPGGHGHGFQLTFQHAAVRRAIECHGLKYFIFSNGDNAVFLNWGASHLAQALSVMERMKTKAGFENLRAAFLLAWETFRKGGFAFCLTHHQTRSVHAQIIEAELASGNTMPLHAMDEKKAGYNTNVALGSIQDIIQPFNTLPMALKSKSTDGTKRFVLESSISTALTIRQNSEGVSSFDRNAALFFLPPKEAVFPHWSHISIRKRSDLFAFHSSLFKIQKIKTAFGEFPLLVTERNAAASHPALGGNVLDPDVLNTKEFFDIFKDSELDVEHFTGVLKMNLLDAANKPRGRIQFRGKIKFVGSEQISITVPAGEQWTLENRTIHSPATVRL